LYKAKLFLLHFAGGNRYSYQFLAPLLADFDLTPLELPGRGRRAGEPLVRDFDIAAKDLLEQMRSTLRPEAPFLIYGHSMGAVLGLRLTAMLEKAGYRPVCLIVSGNCGPGIDRHPPVHSLEQEEFIQELLRLGGIPAEVFADAEIMEFFLPILRADFEIVDKSNFRPPDLLNIPIHALMGTEDEHATMITNWQKYTRAAFSYLLLEGGHFFIHRHAKKIAEHIRAAYNQDILLLT
jgi:surfactin synthase thioesterase subunit